MVDNTTINDYALNAPPLFRISEEGDQTIIRDYATNAPLWRINGKIAGGVAVMTTAERTAIIPDEGKLIYDSQLEALYVGDGVTPGGIPVGSGGGGGGGTPATIKDIMTGSGASKILNVTNIRGALTAGQAVDVTSQPDNVTGDYKGTFSVTGTLGFASFPKFASGLNYLFIADLTATTSGTVTPSGTWLDGTTTAKSLAAGTSTRVAMLFNASNKAKFTFASTGSVSVSNCREYEVTACSAEAVAYIAALSNPDAFASYYLVKADMVQPWTYIIDMGSSPAVTIASGLSYKLNAATGAHQLTVDACPAGYDGRDAIIRITLGGSGVIQAVAPLQLGGALVPYAVNNCVVRFRDGEAVLLVEDTLAGYVVTVNSGTGEGSLPYGLAATGVPYIAFSPSTDGILVELSGATTAAEEVTVVGNGYEETILTGAITCTSKTIVANLSLQNVAVNGGTMTLGDVFIPSGSIVAVSGGGLAIEKVTGAGETSVIDLGLTGATVNANMRATGCEIINGSGAYGGITVIGASANAIFSACSFRDNMTPAIIGTLSGNIVFSNCILPDGQHVYLQTNASLVFAGSNTIAGNVISSYSGASGTVTFTSGAILDLTGNTNATPINPGGGVTFEPGGATVYPSAGSANAAIIGGVTVATISNQAVLTISSTTRPTDAYFENCTLTSTGPSLYYVLSGSKKMTLKNVTLDTKIYMDSAFGAGGILYITGTFVSTSNGYISIVNANSSVVNIKAGAVLTLGVPIVAASIVVEGDITVGGVTVRAGTYTRINTNGTTVPPQA